MICVALAGNIVTGLAKGLRKGFQNYSSFVSSIYNEPFSVMFSLFLSQCGMVIISSLTQIICPFD